MYVGCSIPVRTNDTGIAVLGNLFRDNTLTGITDAGASFFTTTPSTPGTPLDMTLFDGNTFTNLPEGIDCDQLSVGSRTCNILAVRNTIGLGTASSAGGFGMHFGTATSTPGLAANSWSNFGASTYSGATPGAILEAPIRCFSADGSTTSSPLTPLTIANSGTSAMDWTATSDSPWITLSSGAGVIAPGNSTTLTLACNPSNLQPGTYLGTVTLSASSQTKVVTVWFTVASATAARTRRASRMEQPAIPAAAPKVSAVVIQYRPGRAV
jgi:hypothetical protein